MPTHPLTLAADWYRDFKRISPGTPHALRLRHAMLRGWATYREQLRQEAYAAQTAGMSLADRRANAIQDEIDRLNGAPWGVNADERRNALQGELYQINSDIGRAAA